MVKKFENIDYSSEEVKGLLEFIKEGKKILTTLRKTLNVLIVIAGIVFIPFLYSFVDIQVRLSDLQSQINNTVPSDKIYESFVQKTDALAVHMYEEDWMRTQWYKLTHDEEYKKAETGKLIEGFFSSAHRGANK